MGTCIVPTNKEHIKTVAATREPGTVLFLIHCYRFGPGNLFGLSHEVTPVY
jgi:hypothetical protein